MCFKLMCCKASTREVIWTGTEQIIQEARLFFWLKYRRRSEKCERFSVPSTAGFVFPCLRNHWCFPCLLALLNSQLFVTVKFSQAAYSVSTPIGWWLRAQWWIWAVPGKGLLPYSSDGSDACTASGTHNKKAAWSYVFISGAEEAWMGALFTYSAFISLLCIPCFPPTPLPLSTHTCCWKAGQLYSSIKACQLESIGSSN